MHKTFFELITSNKKHVKFIKLMLHFKFSYIIWASVLFMGLLFSLTALSFSILTSTFIPSGLTAENTENRKMLSIISVLESQYSR